MVGIFSVARHGRQRGPSNWDSGHGARDSERWGKIPEQESQ